MFRSIHLPIESISFVALLTIDYRRILFRCQCIARDHRKAITVFLYDFPLDSAYVRIYGRRKRMHIVDGWVVSGRG